MSFQGLSKSVFTGGEQNGKKKKLGRTRPARCRPAQLLTRNAQVGSGSDQKRIRMGLIGPSAPPREELAWLGGLSSEIFLPLIFLPNCLGWGGSRAQSINPLTADVADKRRCQTVRMSPRKSGVFICVLRVICGEPVLVGGRSQPSIGCPTLLAARSA